MFTTNPFAVLSSTVPSIALQGFVLLMLALVVIGTLMDIIHKKNVKYFFNNAKKAKKAASRELSFGEKTAIISKTVVHDIGTTSELGLGKRRVAHVLGSAILTCLGAYWFWFFLRVDVSAEAHSVFRIIKADLFVLALVLSSTFGLAWSYFQYSGSSGLSVLFLVLFAVANIVLFGGVYWSKFAHMFYKPGAAIQKNLAEADGSRDNLPPPAEAPEQYGLGIKREAPKHY